MAIARCYVIGHSAPNTKKFSDLDIQRLFPFNEPIVTVFFGPEEAKRYVLYDAVQKKQLLTHLDVPVFEIEIDEALRNELKKDNNHSIVIAVGTDGRRIEFAQLRAFCIQKISSIFVYDGPDLKSVRQYRPDIIFELLGLKKDPTIYLNAWDEHKDLQPDKRMVKLLELYTSTWTGLLFRHHKSDANALIKNITDHMDTLSLIKLIRENLFIAERPVGAPHPLDGDFAAMLRVLLLKIERNIEKPNPIAAFKP